MKQKGKTGAKNLPVGLRAMYSICTMLLVFLIAASVTEWYSSTLRITWIALSRGTRLDIEWFVLNTCLYINWVLIGVFFLICVSAVATRITRGRERLITYEIRSFSGLSICLGLYGLMFFIFVILNMWTRGIKFVTAMINNCTGNCLAWLFITPGRFVLNFNVIAVAGLFAALLIPCGRAAGRMMDYIMKRQHKSESEENT